MFKIWIKSARLECISPYISLSEIFTSNRPFISNHNQTIKKKKKDKVCEVIQVDRQKDLKTYIFSKCSKIFCHRICTEKLVLVRLSFVFEIDNFLQYYYKACQWKPLIGKTI